MPKAWAGQFSPFLHGKAWTGPEPAKRFVSSSFTRSGSLLFATQEPLMPKDQKEPSARELQRILPVACAGY
jgi:hypothetical protein